MRVDTGRLRVVAEGVDPASVLDPQHEELGDAPSPGEVVRTQRERLGMSVEALAKATKIPRTQLELLEADRFDELPGPVFVKGFLRVCARALDLDPDLVLAPLYEREREALKARRSEGSGAVGAAAHASARSRNLLAELLERLPSKNILLWIAVALLIAALAVLSFSLASGSGAPPLRS